MHLIHTYIQLQSNEANCIKVNAGARLESLWEYTSKHGQTESLRDCNYLSQGVGVQCTSPGQTTLPPCTSCSVAARTLPS